MTSLAGAPWSGLWSNLWSGLWPWLAVAAAGALHGLNPASGWMFAAAWGVRSRDRRQALRALMPIAVGHAASMGIVWAAMMFSLRLDRAALQVMAGGLLLVAVALHLSGRMPAAACKPAGHAGLALWSFLASTVHGAGLMLLPALMSLCASGPALNGGTEPAGSLMPAIAAIAVHTGAMLAVCGLIAAGMCRIADAGAILRDSLKRKRRSAS